MKKSIYAIGLLIAVFVLLADLSAADARALKMYALYPEDNFITQGLIKAADEIRKKTDGEVDIKVYPGGQLGSYEDMPEEVRQGTVEFACVYLTKRFDAQLDLPNIPGFVPLGYRQVPTMFFSDKSPVLGRLEEALNKLDIVFLGAWPEPISILWLGKGKRPANIENNSNKEIKIRAPQMPGYRDPYAYLGYQLVTMDYSEVLNAIQTGQIDGTLGWTIENAAVVAKGIAGFVEINYINSTPGWLLANREIWDGFTDEQRKTVADVFKESALETLKQMEQVDLDFIAQLKKDGVEVVEYSDDFNVKRLAEIRANVWPNYYGIFGQQFLNDLDKFIVGDTEKMLGK